MGRFAIRTMVLVAAIWHVGGVASAQDEVLTFDGEAPVDGPDLFTIPFAVPAGTVEIEVLLDDLLEENILDWGVDDEAGWRGWCGGSHEPAIIGVDAASRGFVPGPMEAGEWSVVVGKAKISTTPAPYHVTVTLRQTATLEPRPERRPYVPSEPLELGARWYAGDFHVHSIESDDATPTLDEIATFAESRGLDFVVITDHNTVTAQDFMVEAQTGHPRLLFFPGMEITTYNGHANAIGATEWVSHRIGMGGQTIDGTATAVESQGALLSINHPMLELFDLCIGCAWHHDLTADRIDAVEVGSGGWSQAGRYLDEAAIDFWDELCDQGAHIAALGGSDDHRGGEDEGSFQSPIGDPTTMVFAEALSVDAILTAIRAGRTVVKLQNIDDPMVELVSSDVVEGDTVSCERATLVARVTGGSGQTVRFVQDGVPMEAIPVDADPFEASIEVTPSAEGETRWRAEVLVDGRIRTVTSNLWFRWGEEPTEPVEPPTDDASGCGCSAATGREGLAVSRLLVWL